MAAHKVKGLYYTLSVTPTGDQLTVHPYRGDLGTFEIGPGGRTLKEMTISGSLDGEQRAVAVGGDVTDGSPKPARSCQLPVGDYRPNFITLQYGRLHINASYNYHSDGKPRGRGDRAAIYAISIRKDKPFVLDFADKPDVMFASPAKDQRVKLGESLEVKAVLVDPKVIITRANGEKVAEGVMPFG